MSQAIYQGGGSALNDTWSPGTYAWINCGGLRDYFKGQGLWVSSTGASAGAGDVILMCDEYNNAQHAAMVAMNDTVTRTFSAHTNDRLKNAYSASSTFGYSEVEFYGFVNWVVGYNPDM